MTTSEQTASVASHTDHARMVGTIPFTEAMVSFRNIGHLLEQRVDENELKPFLIFYAEEGMRREYSYREFWEEVCKTANYLHSIGVRKGDRVATVAHNHSDTVIQYFAAFVIGAVMVPVNVDEDDRRIAYVLHHARVRVAFVRDAYLDRILSLRAGIPGLSTVVQVGKRKVYDLPFLPAELARQPEHFREAEPPGLYDEALLVYTSGTTGTPKGVVLLHYNLLANAMAIVEEHRISPDQRMMCVLPIHHANGVVMSLLSPLYAGGGTVLCQRFSAERFFERISSERIHVVSVVPTMLQFLLRATLNMAAYKMAHFRYLICGGGPLSVELATRFEHTFGWRIIPAYGLSESTCYSCFLPTDLSAPEHRSWMCDHGFPSIGVPLPVNDMAVIDADGQELGEGQRGEIVIRGHNVMSHYEQAPEATAAVFAHDWLHSGDEGFYLTDQQNRRFFFITGRLKEIIVRGGRNISPFEIDEVLQTIPGVHAGLAVGFDNEWYGEEVGAVVKPKPTVVFREEQVLAFCRKHLPFDKSPKVVVFTDNIPEDSTGKYHRGKCREFFLPWKDAEFREE